MLQHIFIDESRRSISTELGNILVPRGSKPIARVNNLHREVYTYTAP